MSITPTPTQHLNEIPFILQWNTFVGPTTLRSRLAESKNDKRFITCVSQALRDKINDAADALLSGDLTTSRRNPTVTHFENVRSNHFVHSAQKMLGLLRRSPLPVDTSFIDARNVCSLSQSNGTVLLDLSFYQPTKPTRKVHEQNTIIAV